MNMCMVVVGQALRVTHQLQCGSPGHWLEYMRVARKRKESVLSGEYASTNREEGMHKPNCIRTTQHVA